MARPLTVCVGQTAFGPSIAGTSAPAPREWSGRLWPARIWTRVRCFGWDTSNTGSQPRRPQACSSLGVCYYPRNSGAPDCLLWHRNVPVGCPVPIGSAYFDRIPYREHPRQLRLSMKESSYLTSRAKLYQFVECNLAVAKCTRPG